MPRLRINLFGGLKLAHGPIQSIEVPASVLGYLLLQRRRQVTRQELAGTLWADVDDYRARRCLSTTLWRLKQTPGLRHDLVQSRPSDSVAFAWDVPGWLDTVAFECRIAPYLGIGPAELDARAVRRLTRAADIYQGDLLPDIQDEWILVERQRFETLHRESLYQLTCAHFAARRWSHVLLCGGRLSALDPLREDIHRLLMCSYAEMGNRAKAVEQYRICQAKLDSELGVEPMDQTKALYREILPQSAHSATLAPRTARIDATIALAGDRIRTVRSAISASDSRLAKRLELIGRAEKESF